VAAPAFVDRGEPAEWFGVVRQRARPREQRFDLARVVRQQRRVQQRQIAGEWSAFAGCLGARQEFLEHA
jgi:hypothetical protein